MKTSASSASPAHSEQSASLQRDWEDGATSATSLRLRDAAFGDRGDYRVGRPDEPDFFSSPGSLTWRSSGLRPPTSLLEALPTGPYSVLVEVGSPGLAVGKRLAHRPYSLT